MIALPYSSWNVSQVTYQTLVPFITHVEDIDSETVSYLPKCQACITVVGCLAFQILLNIPFNQFNAPLSSQLALNKCDLTQNSSLST